MPEAPARARCSHGNLGSLRWDDPDGSFMEPLERFFLLMALVGIVGMVATVAVAMFVGQAHITDSPSRLLASCPR